MPANDNFASATALAATTSGTLYTQSNAGASTQSGEPGHFNYNKGPFYPLARTIIGPFATVWYSWACPTTGNYYFSTRDLSGINRTNFQSTLQAFTGSAVNSLASVTYLMDQSVGDGDGADNGASIAFAATSGTTYYFQVDGRISGATGNFWLTWGSFAPIRLGTCSGETVTVDTRYNCVGSVQIADITTNNYTPFGTYASAAGNYIVGFVSGNVSQVVFDPGVIGNPGGSVDIGGQEIVVGNFGNGFVPWWDVIQDNTASYPPPPPSVEIAYASGSFIAASKYHGGWTGAAVANMDVPAMSWVLYDQPTSYGGFLDGPFWLGWSPGGPHATGTYQGGFVYSPTNSYVAGDYFAGSAGPTNYFALALANVPAHHPGAPSAYWTNFPVLQVPTSPCQQVVVPDPGGAKIGIINFACTGPNTTQNPTFNLLYYPMDTTVLNSSPGFALTGSGTSWTISVYIQNDSSQIWDNTTVQLLNTGGVSAASAALTGISLAAHASTSVGFFTFTATPGMVTASIKITRNGQVACTLAYPLYPIAALSFTAVGGGSGLNLFERTGCSPHTWVQKLACQVIWPPNTSAIPSSWGNTLTTVFSIASGPATMANDNGSNNCLSVSNITNSSIDCSGGDSLQQVSAPSFWVTGTIQSVPIQCTLTWNGISLPMFTQTLSIPAT